MGTSNSVYIPDKDNLSIISFLVPPSVLIVSVGMIVHPVHRFSLYFLGLPSCAAESGCLKVEVFCFVFHEVEMVLLARICTAKLQYV